VAAIAAGAIAVATAPQANAYYFEIHIPTTPCVFYTNLAVVANPQSTPPVDTTGTDLGVRCTP